MTTLALDVADTGEPPGEQPGKSQRWQMPQFDATAQKCPRCGSEVEQVFYGPCDDCRAQLVERYTPPPAPEPVRPPAVTRPLHRKITPRSVTYLDWQTGRGIAETGEPVDVGPRAPVRQVLDHLPTERVYLTGPRPHPTDPGAFRAWAHDAQLPPGWSIADHFTDALARPVLRWRHEDGRRAELLRAAVWWGESAGPGECLTAHQRLAVLVDERWPGAVLLASPAGTGRELIARSIPEGAEWPTLPAELADLVRSTSGQGRVQFWPPAGDELPALVEYDARLAYPALCKELPGGVPIHGRGEHTAGPYARCRVYARWRVPDDWQHVGLLGSVGADGWHWADRPGERAEGWIDGVELHLARSHGWDVQVTEHLLWPKHRGAGPLDGWADRLLTLHRAARGEPLVQGAIRHVAIDALGALVGARHNVTRSAPLAESPTLPPGASSPRIEGESLVWSERREPPWPEMVHPEWPAAVWARCRVRMLDGPGPRRSRTGALHVPPAELLAIRTDALYLARDPKWPDDGQPGRLRRKSARSGPLPAPQTVGQLLTLKEHTQ